MSVNLRKVVSRMPKVEWEMFFEELCDELKKRYPSLYAQIFPN